MIVNVKVKSRAGKGNMECCGGKVVALNNRIREGCIEKATFDSRPEKSDHVDI